MGSEDIAPGLVPATHRQRALAGLVDMAVGGVMMGFVWRRVAPDRGRSRSSAGFAAMAMTRAILEEQVGSPGARVAGIRTVDRRTGRRVEMWRTVLLAGVRVGAQTLSRRLQGGPQQVSEDERATSERELREIEIRFADDPDGRNRALMEHHNEHRRPVTVNIAGPVATGLAAGLLQRRLRRRLAPTVLISRRG